jgi:hypothetical protein
LNQAGLRALCLPLAESVLVDKFALTCLPAGRETRPISKQETFKVYFKNQSNQQNKWKSKFK